MQTTSIRRSVLILAAGALSLVVTAASAAPRKPVKLGTAISTTSPSPRPLALTSFKKKKVSTRKGGKRNLAARSKARLRPARETVPPALTEEQIDEATMVRKQEPRQAEAPDALPETVADARAEWPTPAAPPLAQSSEPAASASPDAAPAVAEIVEPDQLNEIDKAALAEATPAAQPVVAALMDSRAEMRSDSGVWQHTSAIGKGFIALGALLMLGSLARMLMA